MPVSLVPLTWNMYCGIFVMPLSPPTVIFFSGTPAKILVDKESDNGT